MQISDRVIFTGFRADPERVIAGLDAFVLPSRFGEGLPMVLLEAMGAGVPVVTTPVEGIVEVVDDGINGRLVPVDDPASLAEALRSLILEPSRAVELGAAGRDTVKASYTSSAMAAGFEHVYEEVVRLVELPG